MSIVKLMAWSGGGGSGNGIYIYIGSGSSLAMDLPKYWYLLHKDKVHHLATLLFEFSKSWHSKNLAPTLYNSYIFTRHIPAVYY